MKVIGDARYGGFRAYTWLAQRSAELLPEFVLARNNELTAAEIARSVRAPDSLRSDDGSRARLKARFIYEIGYRELGRFLPNMTWKRPDISKTGRYLLCCRCATWPLRRC